MGVVLGRPLCDRDIVNLGNKHVVEPNGPRVIVVDLRARCVIGESLAVVFGVDPICDAGKNRSDPCDQPENKFVLLRGHVVWGLGNARFEASVDILNGTIISLPAETIRVDAEMIVIERNNSVPEGKIAPVEISAGFAYSVAGKHPARLTEVVQFTELGGRVRVPVPRFAQNFTVIPIAGQTIQAEPLAFGPGVSPQYIFTGPIVSNGQSFYPLIGVKCIEITNLGPDPFLGAFVVFGLDF